jgi:glycosyltransferase involved in cell wall biosynthesis
LVLPLARAIHPPRAGFAERSGIGFIGGFEHAPNIDAIRHFLADVWPLVHAADPSIRFEIVGSALPDGVLDGVPGDVRYLGTLDSIDGWLESLRMTVAPLRIGAGAKGKVASSLCAGLPCVLSAVAAEGMDLEDGRDVRVAIDPAAMAAAVVRLHSDAAEWAQLSAGGLAFARARLSVENYKQALRKGVVGMELPADALPV